MRQIRRPNEYPGHSCIDPGARAGTDGVRWFDAGREHTGRLYFTDKDCRMLGGLVGLVHPREVKRLEDEIAARDLEIARLRAELESQNARWAALDVLEGAGFRARRKPGRKAQEAPEEVAA